MKQIERDQPVITLAPIPPTEGGKFNGKMTNDVYTKSGAPSNSVAAIDGVLKGAGFTKVFTEDARFYRELGKFTPSDTSRIFQSDILALSGTTRNTDSLMHYLIFSSSGVFPSIYGPIWVIKSFRKAV